MEDTNYSGLQDVKVEFAELNYSRLRQTDGSWSVFAPGFAKVMIYVRVCWVSFRVGSDAGSGLIYLV